MYRNEHQVAVSKYEREIKQRVDADLLSISVGGRRTVYIISHEPSLSHQFER